MAAVPWGVLAGGRAQLAQADATWAEDARTIVRPTLDNLGTALGEGRYADAAAVAWRIAPGTADPPPTREAFDNE